MQDDTLQRAIKEFATAISKDDDLRAKKDRVIALGYEPTDSDVGQYLDTQCPMLNYIIGRPGVPVGRLTTVIGLEASGKSTLGLHLLAETQRRGGIAVLVDSERRYWKERAERIGIDHDSLVQLIGDTLEESLRLIEHFIIAVRKENDKIPLTIVYDSVAGSPTVADVEASYSDNIPAKHARVLSIAMRRIHPLISRHNVTLVFINQLRNKIQFGWGGGRPQMVMLGEHPLTYWSSLKIHLQQVQRVGSTDDPTGIVVAAEILKNTTAPPFRKCQFTIDFMDGIDYVSSALDVALAIGLVEQNRGWFRVQGEDKPFRRDAFGEVLEQRPDLLEEIQKAPLRWMNGERHVGNGGDDDRADSDS